MEEATGESQGGAALALQKCYEEEAGQGGAAVSLLESQRKGGNGTGSGVSLGRAVTTYCSLPWLQVSWGPLAFRM